MTVKGPFALLSLRYTRATQQPYRTMTLAVTSNSYSGFGLRKEDKRNILYDRKIQTLLRVNAINTQPLNSNQTTNNNRNNKRYMNNTHIVRNNYSP